MTMAAELYVRLLGVVDVTSDGRVVPLGGARQRRLLALLATDVGRVVSIDRIVDDLWSGRAPAGAETTLRTYVSRLRRVLGGDVVVTNARGYSLDIDPERVDVRQFERLLREGRDALARGAPGAAAELLTAALELWRGPPYGDVADTPSLAAEAQRVEELRLDCWEQRLAAELELGRHERVVAQLRSLLQQHPWRERLWMQLIVALYRSGRQADALAAYQQARKQLEAELGLEPSLELQQLERDVLRQQVATIAGPTAQHNLPTPATRLIGRRREMAEIRSLLREHRLVVLTGMGGSGKTRLAIELAHNLVDASPHGVWLVDLAAVGDAALVASAVASALTVPDHAQEPRRALVQYARERELLVVLDNCEHVAEACAALANMLLRECANVRVLATSRIPLGVYGERDYPVDPLATPSVDADPRSLAESPAVQLFRDRAESVRPGAADDDALGVVAEICRDLDGLPLAIELAAARVKALPVQEVSARLDDRFRFLRAWHRVADPRHATLQTTMDWSYGLLDTEEQRLLRRLAVFAGGASLEAVADVCCDGDGDRTLDLLERLVSASLVQAELSASVRYRLLETVRHYAVSRLADDPDHEHVRRRHAEHFFCLAERANLALGSVLRGAQQAELVVAEQYNLRAALDWCAAADVSLGLRIMVALENFWVTHALHEGARRYDQLLGRADDVPVRLHAQAERDRATCFDVLTEFGKAREGYVRSRQLFVSCDDEDGVAGVDFRLGLLAILQDHDDDRARSIWQRCLKTSRRTGNEMGIIESVTNLGLLAWSDGDERGRDMIEDGIERAKALGWWWWAALYSVRLAAVAIEAGDSATAEQLGREGLDMALRAADQQTTLRALAVLARSAAARGEDDRAAGLWSAVERTQDRPGRFSRFDREAYRAMIPTRPDRPPLSLDEAVTLALS